MSLNIKLKRSAVLGSVPTSTQLEDGEIGVNYNVDDPAIYLKDSSGAVVRIAGDNAYGTYWDRTGTTLSPNDSGDDVEIGGGTIELLSEGKISIGGDTTELINLRDTVDNFVGLTRTGNGQSLFGRSADGAAIYALAGNSGLRNVIFKSGADKGSAVEIARLNSNGFYVGGTLPSSPSISLNADGTASFGGNVGIGTDNPLSRLHISGGFNSHIRQTNTSDDALDHLADANRGSSEQTILSTKALWSGTTVASINFNTGDNAVNKDNGYILFRTSNSGGNLINRASISQGGVASFKSNTGLQAEFGRLGNDYRSGENYTRIYGANATNYVQTKACTTADNTAAFDITIGSSQQAVIRADGDMENANGTYGQLSDERLKENIEDAPSQWEDVKETKVRSFNFKEATGYSTHKQIGWVAQEVELISPGCVSETEPEEGEEPKKSVKSSVMLIKAYKALQEAMERIETLEERLAALESSASA